VNFEFRPTTKQLIIGRNGTGKTTVFDVLAMLRDLAVRGKPCEDYLGGKTRTRWQDAAEQRFELDVKGNGGEYRYTLVVDERYVGAVEPHWGFNVAMPLVPSGSQILTGPFPCVKQETLDFNGKPLFRFHEGEIALFNDQQKPEPSVEFPFSQGRSGLAEASGKDNTKLTWFRALLGDHVGEVTDYTRPTPTPKEIKDAAAELHQWARSGINPGPTSPVSMTASLPEWRKIPS
jgi:energy-coupling factor transporter ATP-binding protein EcfA2